MLLPAVAVAAMLGGATDAAHAQNASNAQPIAEWRLDESAGKMAASAIGGVSGTLQGDAAWATGIVAAHAMHLSGEPGGYVDIAGPAVDTSRSFTVMAWVKFRRIHGYQTAVSIDGDQVSGFFLQLRESGQFGFTILPGDSPNGDAAVAEGDDEVLPNLWYHIAGVYDAQTRVQTLYVNGIATGTVTAPALWKAIGHTAIGRGKYSGSPADWFDGDIDDVRFYQSVLSAASISALVQPYRAQITPPAEVAPTAPISLKIDAGNPVAPASPLLYGLMTEEINYSYDGGLYAELIRNRVFQDNPKAPDHWRALQGGGLTGQIVIDNRTPLNVTIPNSLRLEISGTGSSAGDRAGVSNSGYFGIPVQPNTSYRVSFWAKAGDGFNGPLTVSLEGADGTTTHAKATVADISGNWKQYSLTLKTGALTPNEDNLFVISGAHPGTVWLQLVSLQPPTYNNRSNGSRIDLMQKLADMHPAFLRLPGGNYLEGDTISTRFDWKRTLGPLESRSGHPGPWGYRSTDGMGLLEFLEWCEDLHMETVLAVYAGYSLHGEHVNPGADMQPYVEDALDEIEYATGDKNTRWGKVRAENGHPAPFPVHYVEIGNEDWFDRSGSYDARYAQIQRAIKARYPQLQCIATAAVKGINPDVIDEHYYLSARTFEKRAHQYDTYSRTGPKIFVGEWASQSGKPTPDMNSALGDAAWMTGMERNSDVVVLESYAPLFVNVHPGGSQWGVNLIGYNGLTSYGSPSYYAQAMFGSHYGDQILKVDLPTGEANVFASATRDSKSGTIYLKLVNAAGATRSVQMEISNAEKLGSEATVTSLAGKSLRDTNTLADPVHIVPVATRINGVKPEFSYTLAPYSITVLELHGK